MKIFVVTLALFTGLSFWGCEAPPDQEPGAQAGAQSQSGPVQPAPDKAVPDELLVTFKRDTSGARRQAIHQSVGGKVLNQMLGGRIAQVKIAQGKSLAEMQTAYAAFPEVESVEPNAKIEAQSDPGRKP